MYLNLLLCKYRNVNKLSKFKSQFVNQNFYYHMWLVGLVYYYVIGTNLYFIKIPKSSKYFQKNKEIVIPLLYNIY